jgi:acetoin utilization deacetylase AcuC-like enzyme
MSATQKEKTDGQYNEHNGAMKMLNDVMSSYFSDRPHDTDLSAVSHEVAKLLEGIKDDIVPDNTAGIQDDGGQPSTDRIESMPDTVTVTEEVPAVLPEDAIFSEAFREVEFQSVEIAIPGDDPVPPGDEGDPVYSKIVADALKAVPKHAVESVLYPIPEEPDSRPVGSFLSGKKRDNNSSPKATGKSSECSLHVDPEKACRPAGLPSAHSTFRTGKEHPSAAKNIMEGKKEGKRKEVFCKKKDVMSDISMNVCRNVPEATTTALPPSRIAFLYNEKHIEHNPSVISVKTFEIPDRIIKAMWYLEKNGIFKNDPYTLIDDFSMATEKDLLRVHDESYISFVSNYALNGGGFLGDSTYITPKTYGIAKLAAGAALKAGDLVAGGKYSFSFVMTRPPGHHAGRNRYGGFCLFNNAAILARYLQEVKKIEKIMILDWDAHAGDGTMDIFYDDPTVLTVSLHRDPHAFYPRRGFTKETGIHAGKGYSVNVEMPPGAGNAEYMLAFDEVVIPLIERFSPGFIVCSCGFDAYYREKNVGLNLTSEGFHGMAAKVRSAHNGNLVLLMEGGYHDFNGQLCHSVLSALEGKPNPVSDVPEISSFKQNQQKRIFEETVSKLEEVKRSIPMLS